MSKTNISGIKSRKISEKDKLLMRVATLKTVFKSRHRYTELYEYEFGKQSAKMLNKIRMVWNLRETDEQITANLEKIAKNIQ
jgi:hypothetical protein